MALTQAEKNFISLMSSKPKEAFEKIIEKKIDLQNFKNSFYNDGTGLIHILVNGYSQDKDTYKPIIEYIMQNSNLCLSDKSTRGNVHSGLNFYKESYSAFFNLQYEFSEKSKQHILNYMELFNLSKNKDPYVAKEVLTLLYNQNLNEDFSNFFSQHKAILTKNSQNLSSLLKIIINREDIDLLKTMFVNFPDLKQDINSYDFLKKEIREDDYSNILIYALHNNLNKISEFLINNTDINLDGKISSSNSYFHNHYSTYNNKYPKVHTHSLWKSARNIDMFKLILSKMNSVDVATCIFADTKAFNPSKYSTENKNFYSLILADKNSEKSEEIFDLLTPYIYEYKNNNLKFKDEDYLEKMRYENNNSKFLKVLFQESSLDFINKKLPDIIEKFKPDNLDTYALQNITNSLLYKIYSIKNMQLEDYNNIEHILKSSRHFLSNKPDSSVICSDMFYTDIKIFNIMNDNFNLDSISLLDEYSKLIKQGKRFSSLTLKIKDKETDMNKERENNLFNNEKEIINILKKNILNDNTSKELLHNAIAYSQPLLINAFSDNDILESIKKHNCLQQNVSQESLIHYEYITNKLINLKYNFTEEPIENKSSLHYLLSNNVDIKIIHNALKNSTLPIEELSKDSIFHYSVNTEEIADYVLNNGADYSNNETIKSLFYKEDSLKYYLKNGGSVDYVDENGGNILHYLISTKHYDAAHIVLDFYPDLATDINKQQKFAISYMLKDLNKDCEEYFKRAGSRGSKSNDLETKEKILNQFFLSGLDSSKTKPLKFLKEQLEKYPYILLLDESLSSKLEYGTLKKRIIDKTPLSNSKKMKI